MKPRFFQVRSPAQGLRAIQHPVITKNYRKALGWKPKHKKAVLVPCAGTKPFPDAPSHKGGYLQALEGKGVDLWVVSEPLGVVPYEWSRDYPQAHYDFPPEHLRGPGRELLVERVADWLEKVGHKYEKVTLALPGHHMRLVEDALGLFDQEPVKVVFAGIGDCLDAGACPTGHYRSTSKAYRKYLKKRVNPPMIFSNPEEAHGDCYEAAFKYIMDQHRIHGRGKGVNMRLVHATVTGQGPLEGRPIVHAWVEEDIHPRVPPGGLPEGFRPEEFALRIAVDKSMGKDLHLPAAMYRGIGQARKVSEYTWEEAAKLAVKHGHYGPWGKGPKKRRRKRKNPIKALWGEEREPVDVLGPSFPGRLKEWDARFEDGDVGTVRAYSLYTPKGDRWLEPPLPRPGGPWGMDKNPGRWVPKVWDIVRLKGRGQRRSWNLMRIEGQEVELAPLWGDVEFNRDQANWLITTLDRIRPAHKHSTLYKYENNPAWQPPACDPSKRPLDSKPLLGEFVRTHVNLHNGCFVVSFKSKVQGYTKALKLKNVRPRVGRAGWERCNTEQVRNVHAYLDGELVSGKSARKSGKGWRQISYHCKTHGPHFFFVDTDEPFEGAEEVICRKVKKGGQEKVEVLVRGPVPARRNPSCRCGAPRGICSCGEVDAWIAGDPEKITPCGEAPRQAGAHLVVRPWGAAVLLLDVGNVQAYQARDWHERGRCPLLAGFSVACGRGVGTRVTRSMMSEELAHYEHDVAMGARLFNRDLAELAQRVGIPLEQAEDMLWQEGLAWHVAMAQKNPMTDWTADRDYPWMPLAQVKKWIPLMEELGVSKVARKGGSKVTGEGFLQAYEACRGRRACMKTRMATKNSSWAERRGQFIARHMAQVELNDEPLWRKRKGKWEPTKRHLGLIAWAFSPAPRPNPGCDCGMVKKNPCPVCLGVAAGVLGAGAYVLRDPSAR
jgi:hypothetical protein